MNRSAFFALVLGTTLAFPSEKDRYHPDPKWCVDKTAYEVLGLENTASKKQINKAFRDLSLTMHPDKFTDPIEKQEKEATFGEITYAKELLSDKKKRKAYDQYLQIMKDMDSPKENIVIVLLGLLAVVFAITHVCRVEHYNGVREDLAKNKDIKKWLEARSGSTLSRKEKIRARASKRYGKDAADQPCPYSDEELKEALAATFPGDEWAGRPTYASTAAAMLNLPVRIASALKTMAFGEPLAAQAGEEAEDDKTK